MSKQEIAELVSQCQALGWGVETTTKGLAKITPPSGNIIISPGSGGGGRSLGNFKAELRNAGFNPDAARAAKQEKAEEAIAADRKRNEAALERAVKRAAEAALAPAPVPVALPAPPQTLTSPFTPPVLVEPAKKSMETFQILNGYPCEAVRITQERAAAILAYAKEQQALPEGCRQRKINRKNRAKIQQAMELGEWELNPADSLVMCKEHKSIVNGQHRMGGLVDADPEFIEAFYEGGVPFYITTGFPCAMSHIFDTGKARDASDTLTAARLEGWGPLQSAALRLAMQYDQSFEEDGITNWGQWRNITITNTEITTSAQEKYSGLLNNTRLVSRAYSRSKVTRSATMVAQYLFDRDNPDGNPKLCYTNDLFWRGVCDDDDMKVGDPRRAVIRVAARTGAKFRVDNGPLMLAYLLRGYAKYMSGKKIEMLGTPDQMKQEEMLPVWRPGMVWEGQKLKLPKAER